MLATVIGGYIIGNDLGEYGDTVFVKEQVGLYIAAFKNARITLSKLEV